MCMWRQTMPKKQNTKQPISITRSKRTDYRVCLGIFFDQHSPKTYRVNDRVTSPVTLFCPTAYTLGLDTNCTHPQRYQGLGERLASQVVCGNKGSGGGRWPQTPLRYVC